MFTLCIILARAGSKGLSSKNTLPVAGRPMVEHTFDHALAAKSLDRIVVSTDDTLVAELARQRGLQVVDRPAELASDTATVDSAARHAVEQIERDGTTIGSVVILYGNIPLRPHDLIDNAVAKLHDTGAHSVQSVAPVGKMHPYWMKRVDGDRLLQYVDNDVYRRQELPPVFMLDGGIIAVSRRSLFTVVKGKPHAFLGDDRRAIITGLNDVIDVDEAKDLALAELALTEPAESRPIEPPSTVHLGDRAIGIDHPAYIIAELGVNHDGSVERALKLTRAAAEAGADAVKLQLFDPDQLLSAEAELAGYQEAVADDPLQMLRKLRLGVDDMLQVKQLARELGLGFIVTPFSLENVDAMRRLDPDAVKIASPDCVNLPLLRTMMALGKPMIVSVGAAEWDEIAMTVDALGNHPAVLLHCVSAYPTPDEHARLGLLGSLNYFSLPIGYSDHTTHALTGALAAVEGACVLEKHLTYDRAAPGPDHAASADPAEFATYVKHVRDAATLFTPADGSVDGLQHDVRRVSRQSLCAAKNLPANHVLQRGDLTIKRPGTGLPARLLDEVIGKRLKHAILANHLLHEGDLERG
jgi:sialic acid synthase SpsE/CMP-N-acetylneuraminic acid synthetase